MVLDEINVALYFELLTVQEVLEVLDQKPPRSNWCSPGAACRTRSWPGPTMSPRCERSDIPTSRASWPERGSSLRRADRFDCTLDTPHTTSAARYADALHPSPGSSGRSVAATAMLTRNPLYLILLLGVGDPLCCRQARAARRPRAGGSLLRIALGLALLVIPLNALSVHAGATSCSGCRPRWPMVGGNITLEAVLWGGSHRAGPADPDRALCHVQPAGQPGADPAPDAGVCLRGGADRLDRPGLCPADDVSAREIREAQLIRGHRMRRLRDMLPFLMALLTTGLERSFQLAESMEARGFGNARACPGRAMCCSRP